MINESSHKIPAPPQKVAVAGAEGPDPAAVAESQIGFLRKLARAVASDLRARLRPPSTEENGATPLDGNVVR